MSQIQIPKGWTMENLSEHIENFEKRNPKNLPDKKFKYVEIGSVGPDKKIHDFRKLLGTNAPSRARNVIRKNDVIYGTTRPYYRNVVLIPKDFDNEICSTGFCVLRIKNSKLNPRFLFYYMLSDNANNQILKPMRGGSYPAVSNKDITSINIFIPPIPIQMKIIQKLDYILGQLEEKKKTILEKITTNTNLLNQISKNSFFSVIDKLIPSTNMPKDWRKITFNDATKKITYGFTNPMPHVDEGPWIITAKNIRNETIDYTNCKKTNWDSYNNLLSSKSHPKIGTVLLTKDGTLGRVAIVDRKNICINQSVASLEPVNSLILSEFLMYVLLTSSIRKEIEKNNKKTTIGHIQITKLANWTFGLPNKSTQQKIIDTIKNKKREYSQLTSKIQSVNNSYQNNIKRLNYLYSVIMNFAFAGKLVN